MGTGEGKEKKTAPVESGKDDTKAVSFKPEIIVQPWYASVKYGSSGKKDSAPDKTDISKVMAKVADIWSKAGVKVEVLKAKQDDLFLKKEWEATREDERNNRKDELRDNFADDSKLEPPAHMDIIFTENFGDFGITYKPVGPEEGSKISRPLAILAVKATKYHGIYIEREGKEHIKKVFDPYKDPSGLVIDTAHEIGHVLGLQHDGTDPILPKSERFPLSEMYRRFDHIENLMKSVVFAPFAKSNNPNFKNLHEDYKSKDFEGRFKWAADIIKFCECQGASALCIMENSWGIMRGTQLNKGQIDKVMATIGEIHKKYRVYTD